MPSVYIILRGKWHIETHFHHPPTKLNQQLNLQTNYTLIIIII